MQEKKSNYKLLAAYALFKELTKNGKHIHDVLSDFLIDIINSEQLFSFSVSTINGHLKNIYEFNIPDAVVKTLLKKIKFLKYELQVFTVIDKEALGMCQINSQEVEIEKKNNKIIEKLYSYIVKKQDHALSSNEKNKILQSFTDFILDDSGDNCYSDEISLFIVSNQEDEEFINDLQTIKDGVILYTGIKYNQNFNLHASWKSKMTIYLNTEILFHLSGYNGTIFKTLFFDFYNLAKEINSHQKYIYLKFFQETKEEVEYFFNKAEKIVQGLDSLNPLNTAMSTIVDGCKDVTDIIAKKVKFYALLGNLGILEETEEVTYSEENYKYNILSTDTLKEEYENDKSDSTDMYLKILNRISVKREEREKYNLEDIGYIFLTENRKVRNIAWNEEIKEQGVVPLSTTLQFLTNKFWFKLNKGFGGTDLPSSFSVITKAQILLSHHISEKLNKEYYKLKKNIDGNGLTEDEVVLILHELRERAKFPEDIIVGNVPSIMSTMTTESYEQFIIEKHDTSRTIKEQSKKNIELEISLKDSYIEKQELSNEKRQLKESILLEKEKNLRHLEKTKSRVNADIDKRYKRFKLKMFLPLPIAYVVLVSAIYFIGWDKIEAWVWILTISIPLILNMIYMYKKEKSFNVIHILEEKKLMIVEEEAETEDFNIEEIEQVAIEINNLKKELGK